MAKPSKGMIITLLVGIVAILAIAGAWWYYVEKEDQKRQAAARAAFDSAVKDGERAAKAVKDNMEAMRRLKEGK